MKKLILSVFCICLFPSQVLAVGGIGALPMTVWGALQAGNSLISAGATVEFLDGNGKVLSTLNTSKDGQYGGETAYDQNIALSEFTGNAKIRVTVDGIQYNISAENLDDGNADDGCPARDAITFMSAKKCRYDINIARTLTESTDTLEISEPIGLPDDENNKGRFVCPVILKNSGVRDLQVFIKQWTRVRDFKGKLYLGAIFPPQEKDISTADELSSRLTVKKVVFMGTNESLSFSYPLTITIPLGRNCSKVKFYVYSSTDGITWSKENVDVTVSGSSPYCKASFDISHMTYFALGEKLEDDDDDDDDDGGGGGGGGGGSGGYRISRNTTNTNNTSSDTDGSGDTLGSEDKSGSTQTYGFLFTDIENHWAKAPIEFLTEGGIITNQEKFRPDDLLNRAELAKIVVEAFDIDQTESTDSLFPDVSEDAWYAKYVNASKKKGVINGHPDGTFKPADNVLRSEALKMILLAFGVENPDGDFSFRDVPKDVWFAPYVGYAYTHGIVQGISAERFAPENPMTRAEVSKIIALLLQQ